MDSHFLSIKNLSVQYVTEDETVYAVNDVSFDLNKGSTLGLVGETGAGKTTIARAILRILPVPPAVVSDGEIWLEDENLLALHENDMQKIRGARVSMIFQDPMTALNPVLSVGKQIAEVILLHNKVKKQQAKIMAQEMLEQVGIPAERYDEYPHQFSGGMKQRVVIAIALACNPVLLLADEPTTALDVTIQAQVLRLMSELNKKNQTSTVLITHDLGVVAKMCDEVAIIYAGQIVEKGSKEEIFLRPLHPYTQGLFEAIPKQDNSSERLHAIKGMPIDPTKRIDGCAFAPRCPRASDRCFAQKPKLLDMEGTHSCRCFCATEDMT